MKNTISEIKNIYMHTHTHTHTYTLEGTTTWLDEAENELVSWKTR